MKHRDLETLRFDWLEPEGVRVTSVNEKAIRFLPLEMHGEPTDGQLWRWLRHRIVPKHRNYIQEMLIEIGVTYGVRSIIEISMGLSLNDVHWVCQETSRAKWRSVNLYDNPFSATMSVLAFTGGERKGKRAKTPPETSPEFSTNGMLAKCWRRNEKGIFLYKSGSEHFANAGYEPYSEYYAAQIAEVLGYEHVPYGLEHFKGRLFRFKRHPHYNLSAKRLSALEDFLQNRASKIVEYGKDADRFLLIDEKTGGEHPTEFGGDGTVSLQCQIIQNIEADPYVSQEELSQIIGVSVRTVQRAIAELKKQGVLSLVGTGRVKSWKVIKAIA